MKHFTKCLKFLLLTLFVVGGVNFSYGDEYELVTDAGSLSAGDKLVFVQATMGKVAGDISSNIMASVDVTISNNKISSLPSDAVILTLGGSTGQWTFANDAGNLLGATAVKKLAWDSGTTTWSISISSNDATITNGTSTYGRILYNVSSPRFTTYTSSTSATMTLVQLYRLVSSTPTAATPTFSPAAGSYDVAQNVEISTDTEGATIHYTTDGTTPTINSSVYSSAISVSTNTTIKAIAVKSGMTDSDVATASYTFKAATPTFSLAAGTYDVAQNVEIATTTEDATIYYTTDGSTPTTSSSVYSSAITVDANQTLKAIAVKSGLDNSDVATAAYEFKVAAPTFSPAAGTYDEPQNVTITTATVGANIYYTTDGSTPTASSTAYSSAIPVSVNTTLKAIAIKDGLTNSDVSEAAYVFKVAAPTFSVAAGKYTKAQTVELSTTTDGATIYYRTDGYAPTKSSSEIYSEAISVTADMTIKAVAVKEGLTDSDMSEATYDIKLDNSPGTGYFEKVTNASDLTAGDNILIVNETYSVAMSTTQNKNNRGEASVEIVSLAIANIGSAQRIFLQGSKDKWYFYTGESGFLYASSSTSNNLNTKTTKDDNAKASISISDGDATILFQGSNSRKDLRYNNSSSLFSCYSTTNTQNHVQIYKEMPKLPVTVSEAGYATYVNNTFDLNFSESDIKAYKVKVNSKAVATLTQVDNVPAGTPVLLYKEGGATEAIPTMTGAAAVTDNDLVAGTGAAVATIDGDYTNMILNNVDDKIGFYYANGQTVAANRAYLHIATTLAPEAAAGARMRFVFADDASGIKEIATDKQNDGAIYNLSGQRVNAGYKGIVIKNGKKYLNK